MVPIASCSSFHACSINRGGRAPVPPVTGDRVTDGCEVMRI